MRVQLLVLPLEIQDLIYGYAFGDDPRSLKHGYYNVVPIK